MRKIEIFERAIEEKAANLNDYGINSTAFWAYRKSIEAENDLINFYDVIWDNDIEPITETLKQNGITRFTISSNFSGLLQTLAEFEKYGFRIECLTEVYTDYKDWQTGERTRIPAVQLKHILETR